MIPARYGTDRLPEFLGLSQARDTIRQSGLDDDTQLGAFADIVGLDADIYTIRARNASSLLQSMKLFSNGQAAKLNRSAVVFELDDMTSHLQTEVASINSYPVRRPGLLVTDSFGVIKDHPVHSRLVVNGLKVAPRSPLQVPQAIVEFVGNHSSETRTIRNVKCSLKSFLPEEKVVIIKHLMAERG